MKIRIKGNTIRIRLSKSEVDRFAVNHRIEDHTEFGDTKFSYALVSGPQYAQMGADFKDGIITMFLTEKQAEEWTKTTLIGLENDMPIGNGKNLYVLLEKDFKCIDETHEDQTDKFDHPLAVKKP